MALRPCRECGNPVSNKAEVCPHCGIQLRKKRGYYGGPVPGQISAIFGCIFAVLGMVMFTPVFVPIAALFTVFSLIDSVAGLSIAGILFSLLSGILTVIATVTSPSMWLILGIGAASVAGSH